MICSCDLLCISSYVLCVDRFGANILNEHVAAHLQFYNFILGVFNLLIFYTRSNFSSRFIGSCNFGQIQLSQSYISTTMIIFASLQDFMSFKYLTPSKSVPQKSNHGFEKYPYVRAGTLQPMRIKDILTNNSVLEHK